MLSIVSVACRSSFESFRVANSNPAVADRTFEPNLVASSNDSKSPLLEIVLRVLDALQIIPKRRSRRSCMLNRYSTLKKSMPQLLGGALFKNRMVEKPLLALSLESSEAVPDRDPMLADDRLENDEEEFYPVDDHRYRWTPTSERFYDMVLDVLHVLESQARQEVQRVRVQLETELSAESDEDRTPDEEQPA
ncbi:uncharacterized protein LOC128729004 [Anopheles nili]|uniref:uncharacterized protein LOC128729004 n=1 Tax=Anopheles nili TaxID=185578 RepID=UPI00237BDE70|nr:uncharacterized protein LOC128729004 [Anopheles nili]